MTRFSYDIIIDNLPRSRYGNGSMTPNGVTIHHSAVQASNDAGYDPIRRAKQYATHHMSLNGGIAYHVFIPYDDSDKIYICQYFNTWTNHNSNYQANRQTLAILVDGNFQIEQPHPKQLMKLRQILDDLANRWFEFNWKNSVLNNINPKDNSTIRSYSGVNVKILHWHNEVAQPGNNTACCGANLIPYVIDYREKNGNVEWGVIPNNEPIYSKSEPDIPEYIRNKIDIETTKYIAIENVSLVNLKNDQIVKTFNAGDIFDISRITYKKGIAYAVTKYSADRDIYNGIELSKLVEKKAMEEIKNQINNLTSLVQNIETKTNNLIARFNEFETQNQNQDEKLKFLESTIIAVNNKNYDNEILEMKEKIEHYYDNTQSLIKDIEQLKEQIKSNNLNVLSDNQETVFENTFFAVLAQKFMNFWKSKGIVFTRIMPYILAVIPSIIVFLNDPNVAGILTTYGISAVTIIRMLEAISDIAKKSRKYQTELKKL